MTHHRGLAVVRQCCCPVSILRVADLPSALIMKTWVILNLTDSTGTMERRRPLHLFLASGIENVCDGHTGCTAEDVHWEPDRSKSDGPLLKNTETRTGAYDDWIVCSVLAYGQMLKLVRSSRISVNRWEMPINSKFFETAGLFFWNKSPKRYGISPQVKWASRGAELDNIPQTKTLQCGTSSILGHLQSSADVRI